MRRAILATALAVALGTAPPSQATGIPVVDVAAIVQLIQQIGYWQQQIRAMAGQLQQLQQTYDAMTGGRGMEQLVPDTAEQRNYLPPDYAELMATLDDHSTGYSGLASELQTALRANAVLSTEQMGELSPETRQLVEQGRRSAALVSVMSQTAYRHTSQRFAVLQQLISMIAYAHDQKAIEDLQTRVNAEQAMLTNEQSKLQALFQVAQADQIRLQQRAREQSAADIGSVKSVKRVSY